MRRRLWPRLLLLVLLVSGVYFVCAAVSEELATSRLQARYFAGRAKDIAFAVQDGPSDRIRFPEDGPYDLRFGYSRLPEFTELLEARGYRRERQARWSDQMLELTDSGLFAPYHEKTHARLDLLDCNDEAFNATSAPSRTYGSFDQIPGLLVGALLFIENRDLLDPEFPTRNPALDVRRFTRAAMDQGVRFFNDKHDAAGGSTLATQIEKYRHSRAGRTSSPKEKLRQMASASMRAYLDGPNTVAARQRILLDYLNSVPLSARAGLGEINGLGDGLWAWYGQDFDEANRLLANAAGPGPGAGQGEGELGERQAKVFKEALSLIIAQRGPSHFLRRNTAGLVALTDSYLRLLSAAGAIPPWLRDAALAQPLKLSPPSLDRPEISFVSRKALSGVRTDLLRYLDLDSSYELDRLDLTAHSTINTGLQRVVTEALLKAGTRDGAHAFNMYGHNLLREGDDPGKLAISFTLYEKIDGANLLRVQADNLDLPFDLNRGARLNLGSTAKLRTLVTYLEIISELHEKYAGMTPAELREVKPAKLDALTQWVLNYLLTASDKSRPAILEAAMLRRYSGGAGEAFFTGGGLQTFTNFERWENTKIMPVREGFEHSVNLVFIRLMRDIVRYETYRLHPDADEWLNNPAAPQRRAYLVRFADKEGSDYLRAFYSKYRGKTHQEALKRMLENRHFSQVGLAVALRSVEPDIDPAQFNKIMRATLPRVGLTDDKLATLYRKYGQTSFSLNDRGYLARVHPLELWLLDYLRQRPDASVDEVLRDSTDQRQEVYAWLFKARNPGGQTRRIRSQLERQAFAEIARRWQRLGYPFSGITPSYASAIGAAGDRPAALAELVGIIQGNGVRQQATALRSLEFAQGTPYATDFGLAGQGKRLLSEDISEVVRAALVGVVNSGTAGSLKAALGNSGIVAGGKTGTGDHRYEVYGPGGRLISSRVVSRSATFVFFLGDRYFGNVTAYVQEPYAARYAFTSALSVQLLKSLAPTILPLVRDGGARSPLACRH
ncbi:transglycosylase domain-containing protein [Cupriavidus basilensis]|uniref:transglycosylase domain-containing protein n=1 Tax=Cupriavidus basilensis TaxID=68895 RepID=UPI0023E76321|nr:transglycosylase domain-containing protein [Cupriavidus basilensis]MDF3885771.1 transglycosylase domain-containing protein [Cupriavidus basilensis]